jgi:hypothetical protein
MITGYKLGLCSILVNFTTILIAMPFDNVKTQLEKHYLDIRVEGNSSSEISKISIYDTLAKIYNKGGVVGFFVGWRLKLGTYSITSIMATAMIEYIDHLAKNSF